MTATRAANPMRTLRSDSTPVEPQEQLNASKRPASREQWTTQPTSMAALMQG
ncbi:MAG TPA: hypothetical protein VNK95_05510 [Caldilineaceae bacterium]|nr:hypothetical protein [Caldilineaceae bacterium]